MKPVPMKFCPQCGSEVIHRVPPGDNRERAVCGACNTIHYSNPKIVVGCVPEFEGKILLCKRAIEPRRGYWTLPAGFMENGETTSDGAARETLEEACAEVEMAELYTVVNLPRISQVYMMFRATLKHGDAPDSFAVGEESLEVRLFDEQDIPWGQLAFPTINYTLEHWFADYKRGEFTPRMTDIVRKRYEGE